MISPFKPAKPTRDLLDLFAEAGSNAKHAAELLHGLIKDFPEQQELGRELLLCEQTGDRLAHKIIHQLHSKRGFKRSGNSVELLTLATAIDDIVDHAEHTGDTLSLYAVEAPMEQAVKLSEVLVQAASKVSEALDALRHHRDISTHLIEIHRLENDGDRLLRDALASLFAGGIDPMVVIRWKDIFESLEQAVDACETVAHQLEGIALKLRLR